MKTVKKQPSVTAQLKAAKAELKAARSEIKQLNVDIEDREVDSANLDGRVIELDEENRQLRTQNESLHKNSVQLERGKAALHDANIELARELKTAHSEINKLHINSLGEFSTEKQLRETKKKLHEALELKDKIQQNKMRLNREKKDLKGQLTAVSAVAVGAIISAIALTLKLGGLL